MENYLLLVSLLGVLLIICSIPVHALTCEVSQSCSGTVLLRMSNKYNAHAELPSSAQNFYWLLCCSDNETTIGTSCSADDSQTFLLLSGLTNSHVSTTNGIFPYRACISTSFYAQTLECTYSLDSCPSGYICLASLYGNSVTEATNTHISACDDSFFRVKVCCRISLAPHLTSKLCDAGSPPGKNAGENIMFAASFIDPSGYDARMHVCKTNEMDGFSCANGSWCISSYGASPRTCTYTAQESDNSSNEYYIFLENGKEASLNGSFGIFYVNHAPKVTSVSLTPSTPRTNRNFTIQASCTDRDPMNNLTVYWNLYKNGLLQNAYAGSKTVNNGTKTNITTVDYHDTVQYENWTAEVWCGDGLRNSSTYNISAVIQPPGPNIVLKLKLNNKENYVYLPPAGIISSSSLESVFYNYSKHYYVASYLNNTLYALVYQQIYPISISANSSAGAHSISLSDEIENSLVFLVFTKGDWKTIDDKISKIENGKFLEEKLPSFAYGGGLYNKIKMIIKSADIDILGNLKLGRGVHSIYFESGKNATSRVVRIGKE